MRLLTTDEVARVLGLSLTRVRAMIEKGQLPARKFGRDWAVTPQDVRRARNRPGPGRPRSRKPARPRQMVRRGLAKRVRSQRRAGKGEPQ